LKPVGFSQPLLPLGQLPSGHLEAAPGIAPEAGTGSATLPATSLPASASSSAQRLPQPQLQPSTESAPESPVHARTDSVASTSSPGQSNHEGEPAGNATSLQKVQMHVFLHHDMSCIMAYPAHHELERIKLVILLSLLLSLLFHNIFLS